MPALRHIENEMLEQGHMLVTRQGIAIGIELRPQAAVFRHRLNQVSVFDLALIEPMRQQVTRIRRPDELRWRRLWVTDVGNRVATDSWRTPIAVVLNAIHR